MSLDHGVPNRLGTINVQLDRSNAEQHRNQRVTAKRAAEQRRADKARAAALLAEHQAAIISRHGARFGIKPLKDLLASMAAWEPARLITFVNKFLAEQVAA